ncbi:MAG: hypothetical protein AB8B55_08240 [Mariniblastus sp.]
MAIGFSVWNTLGKVFQNDVAEARYVRIEVKDLEISISNLMTEITRLQLL